MANQSSFFRAFVHHFRHETPGEAWVLTGALTAVCSLAAFAGFHKLRASTEVGVQKKVHTQWMLDEPGKMPTNYEIGRDEDPAIRKWKVENLKKQYTV